jgi:hypothetical protein
MLFGRVTGLDRPQCRTHLGDAQSLLDGDIASQGDILRDVTQLTLHSDRATSGPQHTRDQSEQGGLTRAIGPDQPTAADTERRRQAPKLSRRQAKRNRRPCRPRT